MSLENPKNPEKTFSRMTMTLTKVIGEDSRKFIGGYSPETFKRAQGFMARLDAIEVNRNPVILAVLLTRASDEALVTGQETEGSNPRMSRYFLRIYSQDAPTLASLETLGILYKRKHFAMLPGAVGVNKSATVPKGYVDWTPEGLADPTIATHEQALAYIRQYRDVLLAAGVACEARAM